MEENAIVEGEVVTPAETPVVIDAAVSIAEDKIQALESRVDSLEKVVAELLKFWNDVKDNPYIKKSKGGLI